MLKATLTTFALTAAALTPLGLPTQAATAADPCATPTITGTSGDDHLEGTSGDDVIAGLGGNDRIFGRGGDDILCGGADLDLLYGGTGNDRLYGGMDQLQQSRSGIDYLAGDQLRGGPGNDLLDGGIDTRLGGTGQDELHFSNGAAMTIDLRSGTATGEGTDTIVPTSWYVHTGRQDDVIKGSDFDDVIVPGHGDDRVFGRDGDDVISDDSDQGAKVGGDDHLEGGRGRDHIDGFDGNDVIIGGRGHDLLSENGGYYGENAEIAYSVGVDRVVGGRGNDRIVNLASSPRDASFGGPGSDLIVIPRDPNPGMRVTCEGFERFRDNGHCLR